MPFPAAVSCKVPFYPSILFRDLYFLPTSVEKFRCAESNCMFESVPLLFYKKYQLFWPFALKEREKVKEPVLLELSDVTSVGFSDEWTIPDIWSHQKENHLWCRCSSIRQILHPFTAKSGQVVRLGGLCGGWKMTFFTFLRWHLLQFMHSSILLYSHIALWLLLLLWILSHISSITLPNSSSKSLQGQVVWKFWMQAEKIFLSE